MQRSIPRVRRTQLTRLRGVNLFNANGVARERYSLINYLQPVGLQPGRLAKITFQFNF